MPQLIQSQSSEYHSLRFLLSSDHPGASPAPCSMLLFSGSSDSWNLSRSLLFDMAWMMMISHSNSTLTPKGSCRAKTGENDCNVNSSLKNCTVWKHLLPVRPSLNNLIPRVRHGEASLMHPLIWHEQCQLGAFDEIWHLISMIEI